MLSGNEAPPKVTSNTRNVCFVMEPEQPVSVDTQRRDLSCSIKSFTSIGINTACSSPERASPQPELLTERSSPIASSPSHSVSLEQETALRSPILPHETMPSGKDNVEHLTLPSQLDQDMSVSPRALARATMSGLLSPPLTSVDELTASLNVSE